MGTQLTQFLAWQNNREKCKQYANSLRVLA